jgi:WD40 repeat protein
VRSLHVEADTNTLYSVGNDKKVKVWDLKTSQCATLFGTPRRCVAECGCR